MHKLLTSNYALILANVALVLCPRGLCLMKRVRYEKFLYKGCLDRKSGVKIKRVRFKPHCIQWSIHPKCQQAPLQFFKNCLMPLLKWHFFYFRKTFWSILIETIKILPEKNYSLHHLVNFIKSSNFFEGLDIKWSLHSPELVFWKIQVSLKLLF